MPRSSTTAIGGTLSARFSRPGSTLPRRKDDVRKRIVLALLTVQNGLHRELARIDLGLDTGTEHPEGVEALRARPLRKDRVLRDDLDRGDVVDAGIAENVPGCVALGPPARAPADDDAELAFV